MDVSDGEVRLEREPNDLDRLLLDVAAVLERSGVSYAAVSGYVAVLFGRARATEDIDVIVERFDRETAADVAADLREAGFWGSAMPLDRLHETLDDGLPFRVAEDGDRVPSVELKFATDEFDRISLRERVAVRIDGDSIRIGSPEMQIAYKLGMGAEKDFEDALHLYETFQGTLNTDALERYVDRLGVSDEYDRLR